MPDLLLVSVFLDYRLTDINDINPSFISVDFVAPISHQYPCDVSNKAAVQVALS